MEVEQECLTGLALGLAVGDGPLPSGHKKQKVDKPSPCSLDLTVTLYPSVEAPIRTESSLSRTIEDVEDKKRVRSKNNSNNISGRKKLRLTKEQSSLLENTFKLHTTLTPVRKQTLAEQLNLKPRQVEVWFQNRRARTKLKQTEVDCEFLKKCYESLSDENRRLKKELQELRSINSAVPSKLLAQIPKTETLALRAVCEEKEGKGDVVLKGSKLQSGLGGMK